MATQAAENPEFPDSCEQQTGAEEGAAFDAAVSEFLAYPPSLKLRRTSLQGCRQLALSFVERASPELAEGYSRPCLPRAKSNGTVQAYGIDPYFVPVCRDYVGRACAGSANHHLNHGER